MIWRRNLLLMAETGPALSLARLGLRPDCSLYRTK
jgi:hypothetical protein